MKWMYGTLLMIVVSCGGRESGDQGVRGSADTVAHQGSKAQSNQGTIVFFGNSLTAGYGVDPDEAFPALIGEKMDSAGLSYEVVNAGVSGETTAGGRERIGWILRQPLTHFVLELGANDGLRGLPLEATEENLQAIIDAVRGKHPRATILLAGMQIPPNMGPEYTAGFRDIYPRLARINDLPLIPFLLEGVGGERTLNIEDGIHPNPEGHRIVARNVWQVLLPLIR